MTYVGPAFGFLGVGWRFTRCPGAGRGMACYCDAPSFSRCRWGAAVALNHFALGLNGIYLAAALGMVIYGSLKRLLWRLVLGDPGMARILRRLGAPEPRHR